MTVEERIHGFVMDLLEKKKAKKGAKAGNLPGPLIGWLKKKGKIGKKKKRGRQKQTRAEYKLRLAREKRSKAAAKKRSEAHARKLKKKREKERKPGKSKPYRRPTSDKETLNIAKWDKGVDASSMAGKQKQATKVVRALRMNKPGLGKTTKWKNG